MVLNKNRPLEPGITEAISIKTQDTGKGHILIVISKGLCNSEKKKVFYRVNGLAKSAEGSYPKKSK